MQEITTLLDSSPAILLICSSVFGACVGSFLNVVAARLPGMLFHGWRSQCREVLEIEDGKEEAPDDLMQPPSRCPNCKTKLRWYHNIPVLGYTMLRGRCAFCGVRISARYPLVELAAALLTAHAALCFGPGITLAYALILIYSLLVLTLIDLDHQLLPDNVVLPLLWIGLLANLNNQFASLQSAVIGAMAGYMVLWTIYQVHHRLTGKEGMGYGDFKLLAALGAWFGWQALPVIILTASLIGTGIAVLLMLFRGHNRVQLCAHPLHAGRVLAHSLAR